MIDDRILAHDVLEELSTVIMGFQQDQNTYVSDFKPFDAGYISTTLNKNIDEIALMTYDRSNIRGGAVTGLEAIVEAFSFRLKEHLHRYFTLDDLADVEAKNPQNGVIYGLQYNNGMYTIRETSGVGTSGIGIGGVQGSGSGTINYVTKFIDTSGTIGDSQTIDDGVRVSIGTSANSFSRLMVKVDDNSGVGIAVTENGVLGGGVTLGVVGQYIDQGYINIFSGGDCRVALNSARDSYVMDRFAVGAKSNISTLNVHSESLGETAIQITNVSTGYNDVDSGLVVGVDDQGMGFIRYNGYGDFEIVTTPIVGGNEESVYKVQNFNRSTELGFTSGDIHLFGDIYLDPPSSAVNPSFLTIDGSNKICSTSAIDWSSIINVPSFDVSGFGFGTQNYVTKFTNSSGTIGDSQIIDNGARVGVGTSANSFSRLMVKIDDSTGVGIAVTENGVLDGGVTLGVVGQYTDQGYVHIFSGGECRAAINAAQDSYVMNKFAVGVNNNISTLNVHNNDIIETGIQITNGVTGYNDNDSGVVLGVDNQGMGFLRYNGYGDFEIITTPIVGGNEEIVYRVQNFNRTTNIGFTSGDIYLLGDIYLDSPTSATNSKILVIDNNNKICSASTSALGAQPLDATLTALANLTSSTGFIYQTGNDTFTKHSYGTSANTVCQGNDSRLSDVRTPIAHGLVSSYHTASGLTSGHFFKATGATTFGFVAHGLTYTDVGAAASSHNHDTSNITTGILGVARGGTGAATFTAGYLRANLTNAFTTVTTIPWTDITGTPSSYNPTAHGLVSSYHTVSGLTSGHFLKATGTSTYGFVAHGLTYTDVGAQPLDATLTALAALNSSTGFLYQSGVDTFSKYEFSGAVSTILTNNLTTSRAVISNTSGKIDVSTVTSTELGYVSGVTSSIQTQLYNKQTYSTKLTNIAAFNSSTGFVYQNGTDSFTKYDFGGSGVATTLSRSDHSHSGTYEPVISAGTTLQYWRGDKSWQALNTTAVTEGTNLYYTNTRVSTYLSGAISTVLTSNLTADRALVSNSSGKVSVSSITSTELGYLSGKNNVIDGGGTANYIPIFTGSSRIGNSIVQHSNNGIKLRAAPVSWGSNFAAYEIGTNAFWANFQQSDAYGFVLSNNRYHNGSNNFPIVSGSSTSYEQDGSNHYWYSNSGLAVGTSFTPTERMRLTESGLRIGFTTDEVWNTNYKVLQIGNGLSLFSPTASGHGYLQTNTYLNTSDQYIARYTGGSVHQEMGYDAVNWYIAPSVTAGQALTFRSKMSLASSTFLLDGGSSSTGTATPFSLNLGLTYSDNSPVSWSKCKIFLYRATNDGYGIGIGNVSDIQYHSGGVTSGRHDFYTANSLTFTITGSVVESFVRQRIFYSPSDTQYNSTNLELVSNGISYPTRYPSIGFHRAGIDAMTLLYAGGRTLQVRSHDNGTLDTILTTGNLIGTQTAHYHNALHAVGYEGMYYILANWTPINGDYKWRLTSNYSDPEVSVGHSDISSNSRMFTTDGVSTFLTLPGAEYITFSGNNGATHNIFANYSNSSQLQIGSGGSSITFLDLTTRLNNPNAFSIYLDQNTQIAANLQVDGNIMGDVNVQGALFQRGIYAYFEATTSISIYCTNLLTKYLVSSSGMWEGRYNNSNPSLGETNDIIGVIKSGNYLINFCTSLNTTLPPLTNYLAATMYLRVFRNGSYIDILETPSVVFFDNYTRISITGTTITELLANDTISVWIDSSSNGSIFYTDIMELSFVYVGRTYSDQIQL